MNKRLIGAFFGTVFQMMLYGAILTHVIIGAFF